jgi:hypothetical protein
MSRFIALGAVMFVVGACAWHVGETLSSDAISLALGVLFGTLAGLPVALLVLASERRDRPAERRPEPAEFPRGYSAEPPVILRVEQRKPQDDGRVTAGEEAARRYEEAQWRDVRVIGED